MGQKQIENLTRNPFCLNISEDEYLAMKEDSDFKNRVFDMREKLKSRKATASQVESFKSKQFQTELHKEFDNLGGFVFCVYQKLSIMFDDEVLSPEDKSKILLLCTYMGYDNILKFKNNTPILRSHLPIILRINERSTRTFYKKVESLNILTCDKNKELRLNDNLFIKGEVVNKIDKDFGYIRLFINSYQYLYENLPKSKLKYLGLIYNMLGYLNFHHNVIVKSDPDERDINKLKPVTFKEFSILCGYKEDMSPQALSKLKKSLLDIKLNNNMPLFAVVETYGSSKILVNPHVTYASSNVDTWTSTLELIFNNNSN